MTDRFAEKLNAALVLYTHQPTIANMADYFSKLREAEERGVIGDDNFLNGLATVEEGLWHLAKMNPAC